MTRETCSAAWQPSFLTSFNRGRGGLGHQVPLRSTTDLGIIHGQLIMTSAGYYGDAFLFSNASDYLTIRANANSCYGNVLLCNNGLTVAFWMKMVYTPGQKEGILDGTKEIVYTGWIIYLNVGGKAIIRD